MIPFHHLLANNLVANITNFTVWFALTFWVFLETQSVFATGMIAGIYLVLTAALGIWFGSLVDHHRKKPVMMGSSAVSFALYATCFAASLLIPEQRFADAGSVALWLFILVVMFGVIAGNIRCIALPTLVTLLIPEDRRDKANGLVGMVTGIGFLTTSVISGFLVAWGGMVATLAFALAFTVVAFLHLLFVQVDEAGSRQCGRRAEARRPRRHDPRDRRRAGPVRPDLLRHLQQFPRRRLHGAARRLRAVADVGGGLGPALGARVLRLHPQRHRHRQDGSRQESAAHPAARQPHHLVGRRVFTIQSSIPLLAAGCSLWMFLGPYAEAAEHTTLQKVVPLERQGRVFGFAQSVEQAASPLTAFLIGPLTQFVFIPFMTTGDGAAGHRRLVRPRAGARHRAGLRGRRPARRADDDRRFQLALLPRSQRRLRRAR